MKFNLDGFCENLPGDLENVVLHDYGKSFDAAYALNRAAMELMQSIGARNHEAVQVAFLSMFLRVLMHYQSSLVLAKSGVRQSVKPLLRIQLELTFRLVAVAKDPHFFNRLIEDEINATKSRARAVKRHKERHNVRDDLYDEAIDALSCLEGKGRKISARDIAQAADMLDLYDTSYVAISDSIHSSFVSLEEGMETHNGTLLVRSVEFHRAYSDVDKSLNLAMLCTLSSCTASSSFFSVPTPDGINDAHRYLVDQHYIDA